MEKCFTAIDFETAQSKMPSICQVGLVRFENGLLTKEINLLVQPLNNFYWDRLTEIHGICARHTAYSPSFDKIWQQIERYIKNQTVVAHNGLSFDFPVLRKTLEYYNIEVPEYEKMDTRRIFGGSLDVLCEEYNIPLNHHDALSDAKACAELYLIHLKTT